MPSHDDQSVTSRPQKNDELEDDLTVRSADHSQAPGNATSPHTSQNHCYALISKILGDQKQCARISKLLEPGAQLMVDYLDIVSRDIDILGASSRNRALALLYKLVKSAQVFPQTYQLTGVECSSNEPENAGGFADVFKGKYKGQVVCLKALRVYRKGGNERIVEMLAPELTIWAHLHHEHILPFYGVSPLTPTSPRLCLVSPWMERGNLHDYIKDFPDEPRTFFISDVLNGLTYLHGLQVIHNDLKGSNILISDEGYALIADFGVSAVVANSQLEHATRNGGTFNWTAPELLDAGETVEEDSDTGEVAEPRVTKACDIWSFACILTGKIPYYQYTNKPIGMVSAVRNKEIPLRPTRGDDSGCEEISDQLWGFMADCWKFLPGARPNCKMLQESLNNWGLEDKRPLGVKDSASPTFEAQQTSSNAGINYKIVEELLETLSVQESEQSGFLQSSNQSLQTPIDRPLLESHAGANNYCGQPGFGVAEARTGAFQAQREAWTQRPRGTGEAEGSIPTEAALPTDINTGLCKILDGRVGRVNDSFIPDHVGGSADVFIGHYINEMRMSIKVAIKILRMQKDDEVVRKIRKYIIRETAVWQNLTHQNVLQFLGLSYEHGRFGCPALIAPYCDPGTVNEYLKSRSTIGTRLQIIKGVSEGLQYLHDQSVVHGDIKPSNVLIHDDGRPLLCDFGRSKILSLRGFTTKPSGACRYQPPELLQGIGFNKTTDVYGFAVTSYEIWTGLQPFHDVHHDPSIIFSIIMRDARPEYPDPEPRGTQYIWEVFEDCWRTEPKERPEMEAVVHRLAHISIPES